MPIKTPKELFVMLLTDVRQGTEKAGKIYEEIGQLAQDPQIKEALQARAFVSGQVIAALDECFRLLGEKPAKVNLRLHEVFLEDFRKELNEMQSPIARKMFVLAKASQLTHLQVGSYMALVAAVDSLGHPGVGMLLESCLADKLAFAERTKRTIREVIEQKIAAA